MDHHLQYIKIFTHFTNCNGRITTKTIKTIHPNVIFDEKQDAIEKK